MEHNEWEMADSDNKDLPRIHVGDCGHDVEGQWGEGYPVQWKGALCWRGCRSDGNGKWVLWPVLLKCRDCGKEETALDLRARWNAPYHYDRADKSYSCGCQGMDSSG